MPKRPLKRLVREGAFEERPFDEDSKIRRLPTARSWTPMPQNDDREQGYLKTIKAKSPGQTQLIEAVDAKNLVLALGPAGTGKTYLAIAKAVEALEAGKVGTSCSPVPLSRRASRWGSCQANWRTSSPPICDPSMTRSPTGCR